MAVHLGMRITALRLLLPASLVASVASGALWSETPAAVVTDGAGLFTVEDRAKIETLGADLLRQEGVAVRVVTMAEARGRSPKVIAMSELNRMRLGPKSVVLLILVSPQVVYLQPGTTLVSYFDEQASATICSVLIAPQIRTHAFGAGALAGLTAIRNRLARPVAAVPPAVPAHLAATSSAVEAKVFDPSPWILGLVLSILPAYWILIRVFGRKCSRCRARMGKTVEVIEDPTNNTYGLAMAVYTCTACNHTETETYSIAPRDT